MNDSTVILDRSSALIDRRSYDPNNSIMINRVSSGAGDQDDNLADVSMADVSMTDAVNVLNDSSSQLNANNTSMAGLSDSSAGQMQRVASKESDGGSMYSGNGDDVVVKRTAGGNEVSQDMGNTSMAGLSDMSMGDI